MNTVNFPAGHDLTTSQIAQIGEWIGSRFIGLSSKYLCALALGANASTLEIHWPLDPADFKRCYEFLSIFDRDQLIAILSAAASVSDRWVKVYAHWPELCDLYHAEKDNASGMAPKLYQRMKDLGL